MSVFIRPIWVLAALAPAGCGGSDAPDIEPAVERNLVAREYERGDAMRANCDEVQRRRTVGWSCRLRFADGMTSACKVSTDERGQLLSARCDRLGRTAVPTTVQIERDIEREDKVERATCRPAERPRDFTCKVVLSDRPDEQPGLSYLDDGGVIVMGGSVAPSTP